MRLGAGIWEARRSITTGKEADQASLESPTIQQDVTTAALASHTDVGSKAIDQPVVGPAWVRAAQADDIPELELDDPGVGGWHLNGSLPVGRSAYQRWGWAWRGIRLR